VALLPSFLVGADLAAGRLQRVLPGWSHGSLRVYVVYPHRRAQPARLRAFIDTLVERFGGDAEVDGFLVADGAYGPA
jgi:DNA-binding transcriptional LysR family regulator